jgi:hypothetical protein
MSPDWKPDDSVIEGRTGSRRVRAALKKHGIIVKDRVITSRDLGMHEARHELGRRDMPPGIRSWQLPVFLENCPVFFFLTAAEPGAVVPSHSHQRDLFRIVLSGAIITNGMELKLGDWMFVPSGIPYSYAASLNPGAITMHCYG